ncbi:MAG: hypothetical protein HY291_13980 [Planctomycetes bacterium]|nr:hypothetical protein [Planctomycetota bacterium]
MPWILLVLGFFLLGVVSALYLFFKLIGALFFDPPKPKPYPVHMRPVPVPPPLPARSNGPLALNRAQTLQIVDAEIRRAIRADKLSEPARKELFEYLSAERARLPAAAPQPVPAPALVPIPAAPETTQFSEQEMVQPETQPEVAPEPEIAVLLVPQAETPPALEPAKSERDPESLRRMIAKLHADAEAPAPPEPEAAPPARDLSFVVLETPAPVREEARAGQELLERVAPAPEVPHEPVQAALPEKPRLDKKSSVPALPAVPKKTLAERLFTPENVRILQSLGIGIIFISAVAFVKMNMWEGSSAWQQMSILLAGTALCSGVGYALRRWTSLRITGLGFLILGQLSIVLDTYAALVHQGHGLAPIYPWAPSSLWMISMLLFTGSAWWQARKLDEALFEAFTFFGGMAAYGAGAIFMGVTGAAGERWWMLPAAYVPVLAGCGILAEGLRARSAVPETDARHSARLSTGGWRRWTLWWWMDSAWRMGAGLLAFLVPAAAVYSGRADLAAQFGWHAAAIFALGAGMLIESRRRGTILSAHLGSALLLALAPLYAFAFAWPLEQWCVAFALPGAVLALLAISYRRVCLDGTEGVGPERMKETVTALLAAWGGSATTFGAVWAVSARCLDSLSAAHAAWTAGALLAMGLALALLERSAWGVWQSWFGAAFMSWTAFDAWNISFEWWPAAGFALALVWYVFWKYAAPEPALARHGRNSADLYACGPVLGLLGLEIIRWTLPPTSLDSSCAGWGALALYLAATAAMDRNGREARAGLAAVALSPLLASALYWSGLPLEAAAPWLALLSLGVQACAWLVFGKSERLRDAVGSGALAILSHAVILGIVQSHGGAHDAAALSLALSGLSMALAAILQRRREHPDLKWALLAEFASLGLFAGAGWNGAQWLEVTGRAWPMALSLLAAGALLLSMLGEALSPAAWPGSSTDERPFRTSGAVAALLLAFFAGLKLLGAMVVPAHGLGLFHIAPELLDATWAAALVPLFLCLRPEMDVQRRGQATITSLLGSILAGLLFLLASIEALFAEFWLASCPPDLRAACALFFVVTLLGSVAAGWLQRRAVAPVAGALAVLGLFGCAYGAWPLPPESFGLACVLSACGLSALGEWARREGRHPGQAAAFVLAAGAAGSLGAGHLIYGLAVWPAGAGHTYALAAWVLLAAGLWRASGNENGKHSSVAAWAASCAAVLGGCHALRWAGLDYSQFGPGLIGSVLLLLLAREFVLRADRAAEEDARAQEEAEEPQPLAPAEAASSIKAALNGPAPSRAHVRAGGVFAAALMTAMSAFVLGAFGWTAGHLETWSATLLLEAVYFAALALIARRENERAPGLGLVGLELGAWSLLLVGLSFAAHAAGLDYLFDSPACELFAAMIFALGMAAEALAGAAIPAERRAKAPVAFLESRHLAALGLAAIGVLWAFSAGHAFTLPAVQTTWRTVIGAGLLAAYASMAGWSADETGRRAGRTASTAASYLVLIPAGYLCLLKAHATGSSWGALWFLALAPAQLLAANFLQREKYETQAALARIGALLVGLGSIVLSYASNPERLAAVPCATYATLALLALLARWANRGPERRAYAFAALAAGSAAAFYAVRGLAGDPAFGLLETGVWEWPSMAALGLGFIFAGGLSKWETDARGRSLAGEFGFWLAFAALAGALLELARYGSQAHYLHVANEARFEAFVVALLLASGVCVAARRWLAFAVGEYLAPVLALGGYALYIWTIHPQAWEWYSLPAAVLLFAWARSKADEAETALHATGSAKSEVAILLSLASTAALLPPLIQALPFSDEALVHYYVLVLAGLAMVAGAMLTRRKIPLLGGSAAVLLGTLVKTAQWAAHRQVFMPVLGMGIGLAVVAVGCLFESRMNRTIRQTVDRVRAEARMFWMSWE